MSKTANLVEVGGGQYAITDASDDVVDTRVNHYSTKEAAILSAVMGGYVRIIGMDGIEYDAETLAWRHEQGWED